MQRDEAAAIQTIRRHNQVLEKWASQYQGEVLNFFGDGCLCAFATATEAVKAAMHVQQELKNEPAIPLRIGLHIGEVSFEEGKALGDAVNIASRVQSLAVANSILFSREIYDKLKNHPEFKSVSLGQFEFKNVDEPMEVYALANDGFHVPKREEMSGKLKAGSRDKKLINNKWLITSFLAIILIAGFLFYYKLNAKQDIILIKSIAVLPFKNESVSKAENEPFCNGITLAVLKNLTWIKEFIPIAFQSTERYRQTTKSIPEIAEELDVNYVVLGNVQRYNDQVKVFASLVNGETGQQMWADEFSGEMKDIFTLQDEIAKKIASELHVKLSPEESQGIERVATINMAAWEKYNEALDKYVKFVLKSWSTYTPMKNDQGMILEFSVARDAIDQAIRLDSAMAEAKILKGKLFLYGVERGLSAEYIDSIEILANQALIKDPNSVDANGLLVGYFQLKHKDDSVLNYVNRALNFSPNNFEANKNAGDYYSEMDPSKAVRHYLKALRVDPVSIWTPGIYNRIGWTYSSVGDFQKAETYYKKGLEKLETNQGLLLLVTMYNHWPKPDSAIKYAGLMLKKYDDKNAYYFIAEVTCYFLNDWKKGEKIYEEVWNKYHEHINEHRWAIALYKTGNRAKADMLMEKSYKYYLKTLPDSYDMAGLYAWRGDKKNAYRVLKNLTGAGHQHTSFSLTRYLIISEMIRNSKTC
jgi:TolB-like protein